MTTRRFVVLLWAVGLVAAWVGSVSAHGLIGQRFFPATLAIDDPFVADELSLPTVLHNRNRGSDESPPTLQTDLSGELSAGSWTDGAHVNVNLARPEPGQ